MKLLNELIDSGHVVGTIGDIPPDPKLGFAVWARKEPKAVFQNFANLARDISSLPLKVFVDDICTIAMTGRTAEEQALINNRYSDFFLGFGCEVYFSSSLYDKSGILSVMLPVAQRLTVNEFIRCLPEEKRHGLETLGLDEVGHALLELALFERMRAYCDSLLIGQFSQAVVVAHRNISLDPLSAIIVPKIVP